MGIRLLIQAEIYHRMEDLWAFSCIFAIPRSECIQMKSHKMIR